MPQTLQFGHSILRFLPGLHSGQRRRPDTLREYAESSMPYVMLRGQVTQGEGWVPDRMRMHVERCLHAGHPKRLAIIV